mmetsp:Transcript_26166/g.49392  ORF Transcript_26166/g.49392 Transcript_26166/m.49392 type:complete len:221 (-) Transcript_26166:223-885(-)
MLISMSTSFPHIRLITDIKESSASEDLLSAEDLLWSRLLYFLAEALLQSRRNPNLSSAAEVRSSGLEKRRRMRVRSLEVLLHIDGSQDGGGSLGRLLSGSSLSLFGEIDNVSDFVCAVLAPSDMKRFLLSAMDINSPRDDFLCLILSAAEIWRLGWLSEASGTCSRDCRFFCLTSSPPLTFASVLLTSGMATAALLSLLSPLTGISVAGQPLRGWLSAGS